VTDEFANHEWPKRPGGMLGAVWNTVNR
jgi:hypothetical protein